jgi:hypothetical protein
MKKEGKAGFLGSFYRKRSSSLLLNLYKASITGKEDDIHRTRTDVKKIRAFYHFLEVIYQGKFRKKMHYEALGILFRQAGKLREVHVNLMILDQNATHTAGEQAFRLILQKEEKILARKFLDAVRDFDETEILSKEKVIEKFLKELKPKEFSRNVDKFVRRKSSRIMGFLPEIHKPGILHKIRKHLNAVSAILDISTICLPETNHTVKELLNVINELKTGIGVWHDNTIFLGRLKAYQQAKLSGTPEPNTFPKRIETKLNLENRAIAHRMEEMISTMINHSILSNPRWNRSIIDSSVC